MSALALLLALSGTDPAVDDAPPVVVPSFAAQGRWEAGLTAGFTLVPRLTEHWVFNATVAYNLYESLALEAMGGYAYSKRTGFADELALAAAVSPVARDELSDLWQLGGHGMVGLRWQPVSGKFGLFSQSLHFQAYGWLGAGGGWFKRDSLTGMPVHEEKIGPLVSVAIGMRLFLSLLGDHHAVRIEARDLGWLDSYPSATGPANGITNLAEVNLGYTFVF